VNLDLLFLENLEIQLFPENLGYPDCPVIQLFLVFLVILVILVFLVHLANLAIQLFLVSPVFL
jgi:hypothetical protein